MAQQPATVGVLPAGSCSPPCPGPSEPQGDPHTLFGGPHSGELAPQGAGYTAADLEANAHDNLLDAWGAQIATWEDVYSRRVHAPVHDLLTTRALASGAADWTLRLLSAAGGPPLATARWHNVLWREPPTPAQLRAANKGNFAAIFPPANAFARSLQSYPPDAQLPRTAFVEVEVMGDAGFADPVTPANAPLRHVRLSAPFGFKGFWPEYVVREIPPDIALVRGERAIGNPPNSFDTFRFTAGTTFRRELFDGVARDTTHRPLTPLQAKQLINSWTGPLIFAWRVSHLHGPLTLHTLVRTPVDQVTIDLANLLGPPK